MGVIAKYKFDQTTYENFIPEFNSEFTDYTITDSIDTDGLTIRTITSDSLPQRIKFGETAASYVEKGIQSLIEILFVNIHNGMNNFNGFLANAENLISVNVDGWDTSGIVTMRDMFYNCSKLTSLNVSNFNTEKVENMQSMFYNCSSLTYLDLSNFNTEKVTNMSGMFYNCSSLTSLNLSNFNTEKVTNMYQMFYNCSSLTSLDVLNFNTEKVTNMTNMFQDCSSLTHLDISLFDGSALTTGCGSMFFGCVSLQEIIFPKKFITNKCVNISAMFRNCPSLKYVDVSDWDTSSVKTINQTFNGCKSLTSLDLSSWDTTNVTSYYQVFNGCTSLQTLDISNFNILSSVTDIATHIVMCKKLVHVGMLYCNSETINIIANQIGGTRTIWYQDANLSDLTQLDNITYKKYQSTTLSLNEPIQLRSTGDVHDEINYETGEYIQRIGEIVLDGSESWLFNAQLHNNNGYYAFHYCPSDIKLLPEFMDVNSDRFSATKNSNMINEMNCEYVTIHGWGFGINICIKGDKLVEQNVDGFKQWLSQNPTTVQYQLAQPTTRKVDTTILDQNNSYKSSQQTYNESTYISVQSDTVVTPTSSVDYEIYSSTGTITGTNATIENAEAGTPVSGAVYGETLLNCVQDKGNSEVVCLGDYSGTNITIEDSIEGNIKNAVIKGDTEINLVSRITKSYFKSMGSISPTWNTTSNFNSTIMTYPTNNSLSGSLAFTVTQLLQDVYNTDLVGLNGKTFVLMATLKNGTSTPFDVYLSSSGYNNYNGTMVDSITTGQTKEIKTVFTVGGNELILGHTNISAVSPEYVSIEKILIVEKDTINFSYFEGIKSVTNPSVTVCGKNLFNPNRYTWSQGGLNDAGYPSSITTPSFITALTPIEEFPIKQGETAYLTCTLSTNKWTQVFFYDSTKAPIGRALNHAQEAYLPISLTVPTNASYFRIHLGTENVETGTMTYKKADCVANIGYTGNTVSVNEEVHLHRIGNIYDEFNVTTGELTQRISNITLDGNRNYSIDDGYNGETEDYIGFRTSLADYKPMESNANVLSGDIKIIPFFNLKNVSGEWITFRYPSSGVIYGKILKSKLTEQTIQGIKQYLSENPIALQYELAEPITESVDLLILDQDNNSTTFHSYDTITHINTSSDYLKPTLEITNPTYDVILKANTEYTIKTNRTNRATLTSDVALDVNLGGSTISMDSVTNHVKVTTPSTLENNTLTLSGFGNKVKDVMVIEGDYVDRDLDFFEGFISVENPIVHITCKNLFNPKNTFKVGYMNWQTGQVTHADGNYDSVTDFIPIQEIEPGTYYFHYKDETNRIDVCFYDENKKFVQGGVTKATIPNTTKYMRVMVRSIKQTIIPLQMEKGTSKTEYEPYQGNTLTTHPQVTLRSIGDIKDEWDVVGETVTRRIGEIVLDGSEEWKVHNYGYVMNSSLLNIKHITTSNTEVADNFISNKIPTLSIQDLASNNYDGISPSRAEYKEILIFIKEVGNNNLTGFKEWLKQNPITVQYELETPITESVRITPPNPQTSTASITIPTQLNHVEDISDFLVWNPYKEHYVRYNYVEDGVVLDNYTWENLTDLNERQFVGFYNKRTYIDQPYHNYVASHDSKGTSKYVLIEPNQDYTVSVRFSELPTCETVKVNLGGAEVEMNVNDPHVHVTTPNTLVNNLCSISGDGLDGKVTDILVIHCLEHEGFADIDYFEGIDGIGEIVEVEGVPKSKIVMEQTNGNLIDTQLKVTNNGNQINYNNHVGIRPNKQYVLKYSKGVASGGGSSYYFYDKNKTIFATVNKSDKRIVFTSPKNAYYIGFARSTSSNGSANIHEPVEICLLDMEKDETTIRPRYYDKEEILLPIQLHRINTVYDNFYYDEMKGYYRIQQSIGHKYFVGADSENWTLIERGQRVLRFRYNNADIQIKSLGEFMTNRLPNGTATSPYECCAFNGINFIVSIDKERLSSESLTAFKEWLANNNLHLYYQLASPLMIDLPEYSSRIEFNTYKDELYTFFKNCKPTVFTLSVPLDQTYRFYELEQGEGYANRVELTDERMTEEDALYINTIYGSGISNLIEEPNNVDTMLKPNYEGKATSHSLTNGKVSTIGVHGFEPNNVTISNYNTVTKQYELTVQANQGTNTNTETLAVPYKLEIYEDGTKDRVYYNSQYKQWMFEGGQTLTVPYNASTGAFTSVVEVFRGLQPRSGLIGEFKVRFASGTTSARLYYSINGTTYGYTTLRGMTDEVDYYIGFFNTGGTKIDMGTKIDANAEYTTLVPINGTIPECLMINQIQSITECTYYQDKTYYYSDVVSPLVLDVYDGTTTITELNGAVIDIQNNAHNKQALIYGDTTYTVYWTYVGGEGNIKVTLGGTTQEVVATQGYVTITTSDTDLERGLFIGGFNVTIKDLMLVKGERITDLKYFEGSRAVGTAFTDENGETMYKITLVTGSELINDKFEETITFEDNKKHNVVVTKLLGAKPDKI